jgi:hypothetical protein
VSPVSCWRNALDSWSGLSAESWACCASPEVNHAATSTAPREFLAIRITPPEKSTAKPLSSFRGSSANAKDPGHLIANRQSLIADR